MYSVIIKYRPTGQWVGQAALSNQGFAVPTCSECTQMTPLVFERCASHDKLCQGKAYRVRSTQGGLDSANYFFAADDIALPSIIYRDLSPNNELAYVFDVVPIAGEVVAMRALNNFAYLQVEANRLVGRGFPAESKHHFELYGFPE